jgi:hypothetical protein
MYAIKTGAVNDACLFLSEMPKLSRLKIALRHPTRKKVDGLAVEFGYKLC